MRNITPEHIKKTSIRIYVEDDNIIVKEGDKVLREYDDSRIGERERAKGFAEGYTGKL